MKPRILVLSLLAALGAGCSTTTDKQPLAFRVEPVQSIRHGAPNAQAYYQLGRYYQGQSRLDKAEDAYLKATAQDDKYIDAYNALGSLYAQRGEMERAVKMFEKLIAIVPDAAYLHNNLGFAYYLLGRQEDAYASVKKALALDKTLERGWANLDRIAAKDGETVLVAAVRSRQWDALPLAIGLNAAPGALPSMGEVVPAPTIVDLTPEPKFTVVTQLPATSLVEEIRSADVGNSLGVHNGFEQNTTEQAGLIRDMVSRAAEGAGQASHDETNDVVSSPVSVSMVPESNGQTLNNQVFDVAKLTPTLPGTVVGDSAVARALRLEISNGNGVSRFANQFSLRMRGYKIPVARITNHGSFLLKQTVIEFQPGYDAQALRLMQRTHLSARLVPAIKSRAGVDIRIVLGQDALRFCKAGCGAPHGKLIAASTKETEKSNG